MHLLCLQPVRMVDTEGPNLSPIVHLWIPGPRTRREVCNFARSLVPKSLSSALSDAKATKRLIHDALPARRKILTQVVKKVCAYHREHLVPMRVPPPPLSLPAPSWTLKEHTARHVPPQAPHYTTTSNDDKYTMVL